MAQHDYVIANGTGAAVRSDLNAGFAAIVSQNSGATAPSTTYAYQSWADTSAGVMKMRNGANNAWITLYQLDGEWSTIAFENGTAAAPSIYFKDSGTDTGIYSPGADQVAISTGGTSRLAVSTTAVSSTLAVDVPLGAVGTPSITFTGDLNTGVFSPGADTLALVTGGTNRVHVTSGGLVGIGTTSPSGNLHVVGVSGTSIIRAVGADSEGNADVEIFSTGSTGNSRLYFSDTAAQSGSITYNHNTNSLVFGTAGSEKARLDTSGRLLVGTSSALTGSISQHSKLVQLGSAASSTGGGVICVGAGSTAAALNSGDTISRLLFTDNAAGEFGLISCEVDATPGSSDYPGRLVFSTTADGAASPTERMRIASNGKTTIKGATSDSSAYSLEVTESGGIVQFTIRNDGIILTGTDTLSPYNNTTASAANLFVTSGGELQRSTSSLKYKKNVQDAPYGLQELMALRAVTYQGKSASDGNTVYGGLIAEEVDAAGLQEFVQYADDGTPDALAYGNMVSLCIKAIQEQQATIVELQAKVAALEAS